MNVTHVSGKLRSSSPVPAPGFFLSNGSGSFCCFGILSRYRGMLVPFRDSVLKVVDDIRIPGARKELTVEEGKATRVSGSVKETFRMPKGKDGLLCTLSEPAQIELTLDIRHPYDLRSWGRTYDLSEEGGDVLISYRKETDSREDSSSGQMEYAYHVCVRPFSKGVVFPRAWTEEPYPLDASRHSFPDSRHVYRALVANTDTLALGCGESPEEAKRNCDAAARLLGKKSGKKRVPSSLSPSPSSSSSPLPPFPFPLSAGLGKEARLAARRAKEALEGLLVSRKKGEGYLLYAGAPWFFESWTRDTLLSLRALFLLGHRSAAKHLLISLLGKVDGQGRLPNKSPAPGPHAADSVGLLFLRADELLSLKGVFSPKERALILSKLSSIANTLFHQHASRGLAENGKQETWMDSLPREGERIEIQALHLRMYDTLARHANARVYGPLRDKLAARVRERFLLDGILKDGADDPSSRPNVFLAAYFFPGLLSPKGWERCFDLLLPKLWLDWGGLSTLDTSHPDFHPFHTGEQPDSYHNGDSWYWVNNLSALVLHRLNPRKYRASVRGILAASSRDILFQGFCGAHSELSSASRQEAQGCLNQAWSDAFFLELAHGLSHKG